jgi:hypothetical protein
LNYDSVANHFFVDFVNANIDKSTDTVTAEDGGTITVKLPQALQNKLLAEKFYDGEAEGSYTTLGYTVIDGKPYR